MNNLDIQEIQVWTVTVVGGFYNNMRKFYTHQPANYEYSNPDRFEPLHKYVTSIPQSTVMKTVLEHLILDTLEGAELKKQVVVNTLGEYLASAQACADYLSCPSLQEKGGSAIGHANAYNSSIYKENANFLKDFHKDFGAKLAANIKDVMTVIAATETNQSVPLAQSLLRRREDSDVKTAPSFPIKQ